MDPNPRARAALDELANLPYEVNAAEFIRFRAEANDGAVSGVVRTVANEDDRGREEFRRGLDDERTETVRLFAKRRTLHARRQSSLGSLYEAMDAFALLAAPGDVPWESWLKAALLLAGSIGGDLDMIARRFADVANPDATARFNVAMEAMNRVASLEQCRMVEVTTNYGTGWVEMIVVRDSPGRLSRAPTLGYEVEYHPTTNLAQLAASFADALDGAGRVTTSPIGQDRLAATSFSLIVPGSYLPTTGCLSFIADSVVGGSSFTAFVAELPEDVEGETLAESASATNDQAALYDRRRIILLSPQPDFADGDQSAIDLHDVEDLARAVLAGADAGPWSAR
jgi:hypothetical protein